MVTTPTIILRDIDTTNPPEEAKKAAVPQTTLVQLVGWLDSPEPHVRHKLTELVGDLARIGKQKEVVTEMHAK